jgi:hypothetical protein
MSRLCVTIDADWASEAALRLTLDHFESHGIPVTLFSTHDSDAVRSALSRHEVGLHPFFGKDSDHGDDVPTVVNHVLGLPHNIAAFRCHRFAHSNESQEAMAEAGMQACSNICADLSPIHPFVERNGLLEVPIFFEDGGYLKRGHPMDDLSLLLGHQPTPYARVLVIHPMHFCLNTPNFTFMRRIKDSLSRKQWNELSVDDLSSYACRQRGIRNLIEELLQCANSFATFSDACQPRVIKA